MPGVKTSPLPVSELLARFRVVAPQQGFRLTEMGEANGHPLLALTRRTPGPRPRVYLSSGIHGDEPAGPAALLAMLEGGEFDDRATWFICPVLNPNSLSRGTREDDKGRDLNRDYLEPASREIQAHVTWLKRQPRFDLSLCLHEDWEATGFYLYELDRLTIPSFAPKMIAAAATQCPIDHNSEIDGRPAHAGLIRPVGDPALRTSWPEAIYLFTQHTDRSYTLETASGQSFEQRVAAQCAAIRAALNCLFVPESCA